MQAFFLAISALAKAGLENRADTATATKISFMRSPNGALNITSR
jgi:hypothetical protein